MPAVRLTSRRRRSSHAIFTPAKPGIYGLRPVTFAPNVTPITYVEPDDDDILALSPPPSPSSSSRQAYPHHPTLFPPSSTPAPLPTRKRCPPGKRRSQGYIPRPPNAFMLFRADFVRQKHVPGSIETNHGSLSKIIGNCWRQLPLEEKRIWEIKAKQEKANHKAQFPDYRFRPVHNKNKNKDKSSYTTTTATSSAPTTNSSLNNNADGMTQEEEERRCEQVAQLLLEGMKGEELARAVRDLDRVREEASHSRPQPSATTTSSANLAMPIPLSSFHNPFSMGGFGYGMTSTNTSLTLPPSAYSRRSSSVPLPLHNGASEFFSQFAGYSTSASQVQALDLSSIALPSVPFISQTRPSSPINNISRQHQQRTLGHRRASSAQPIIRRSWTLSNNAFTSNFNTDFSGFDWASMNMNTHTQVQRDESPLPDVGLELFNGFTFDGGVSTCAIDTSLSSASSVSSSVSDRHSPWMETSSHHTHSRSQSQHLAIAPHDLPPLDVSSSDMNWHGTTACVSSTQALLSATSSSSSSTFPSPSLSSTLASASPIPHPHPTHDAGKLDPGMTPTNAMFDLNLGFGLGVDINGGGGMGVDYGYAGYNDMGFSDMGMEMGYTMHQDSHEMGMGMVDTMWNVVGQAQQA